MNIPPREKCPNCKDPMLRVAHGTTHQPLLVCVPCKLAYDPQDIYKRGTKIEPREQQ